MTTTAITPSAGRSLIQTSLFPAVIAAGLAIMYIGHGLGAPGPALQMAAFSLAIAAGILAERFLPHNPSWSLPVDRDRKVDAASFAGMLMVVDPFLKAVSPALVASIWVALAAPGPVSLFSADIPFLAQVFLAAAIAEFGPYWLHRWAHTGGMLWRIHSVHHSAKRVYWFNSYRAHPLNIVWHHFAGVFVLMLLGTPTIVLQAYLALAAVVSVFQHCNAELKFGWLNYVFSTNEVHRWHHSTKMQIANNNFGNVLIIWDLLFGTYYNRKGEAPEVVGITGNNRWPVNSYLKLLVAPFRIGLWK